MSTLHMVRCDATLHAACHDHPCPAAISAASLEELSEAMVLGRWLLVYRLETGTTDHYCPMHRDEQT